MREKNQNIVGHHIYKYEYPSDVNLMKYVLSALLSLFAHKTQ